MRRELLILVALLLLGGALAATSQALETQGRIVGARHPLPAGTRITLGDVMAIDRPADLEPKRAVRLERASTVIGGTLLRGVEAGAPITVDDVGHVQPVGTSLTRPRLGQRLAAGQRGAGRLTTRGLLRRGGRSETLRSGLKRS